jgi:hypothetical protein
MIAYQRSTWKDDAGATMVEYGLMLALIAWWPLWESAFSALPSQTSCSNSPLMRFLEQARHLTTSVARLRPWCDSVGGYSRQREIRPMPYSFAVIAVVVFLGLAAMLDIRTRRIPNVDDIRIGSGADLSRFNGRRRGSLPACSASGWRC